MLQLGVLLVVAAMVAGPRVKAPDAGAASAPVATPPRAAAPAVAAPRHIKVGVTEAGFEPSEIPVKPGETVVLDITRVTEQTCATAIVVSDQNIRQELPLNVEVPVTLHAGKTGRVAFACPMNMITGALVIKE